MMFATSSCKTSDGAAGTKPGPADGIPANAKVVVKVITISMTTDASICDVAGSVPMSKTSVAKVPFHTLVAFGGKALVGWGGFGGEALVGRL